MKESLKELGYIKEEIEKKKTEISESRKTLPVESLEDTLIMNLDIEGLIKEMDTRLKNVGEKYRSLLYKELREYCDLLIEDYDIFFGKFELTEERVEV